MAELLDDHTQPGGPYGLLGHVLDGKYHIFRVVGEGGFGVVFQAEHLRLRVPVAIKVLKIPQDYSEDRRARFVEEFENEAIMIARTSHPNVVTVLDSGVSVGPTGETCPWMVLEWLNGRTLKAVLDDGRPGGLSPGDALALLRPVFLAVAAAHRLGIAHRDIKPANIVILDSGDGRTAKVLDFGIAKLMEVGEGVGSGDTASRGIGGFSPPYAAPEQIAGTRTGPWTDVHALALLLVECLSGQRAYGGSASHELLAGAVHPIRPTPAQKGIEVGPWEGVIARALSIRPSDRFESARSFLDALEATLAEADAAFRRTRPPGASASTRASLTESTAPVGRRVHPAVLLVPLAVSAVIGGAVAWTVSHPVARGTTRPTQSDAASAPTNVPSPASTRHDADAPPIIAGPVVRSPAVSASPDATLGDRPNVLTPHPRRRNPRPPATGGFLPE